MRFSLIGTGISPKQIDSGNGIRVKYRHFVGAALFTMASLLFCWYFVSFPLQNLKFTHGYPRFGTPPSPNSFRSDRYTWGWVFIYIMTALNVMLPFLLSAALMNNTMPEISKLHYFFSRITALLSIVCFIGMSVVWLFFCNRYFPDYSFCHDPRHCCVYFASTLENTKWCPNTVPCDPNVTSGQLTRTDEFFQVWLFSLLFSFWALGHRAVNKDMRGYGMWREVFTQEEDETTSVE